MRWLLVVTLIVAVSTIASDAAKTAEASKKAAAYLAAQQNPDGTFGKGREAPLPGLVGLVLEGLAHSPGKPREAGSEPIKKAAEYILKKQQADGSFAIPDFGLENYNTSVAVIGLTALENPAHKAALAKARDFILKCQYSAKESDAFHGSFGYSGGKPGDLSNTCFSLEALKAAGVDENSPAFKNALVFIRRCQDNPETNDVPAMKSGNGSGGFVYTPGESPFGTESNKGNKYVPRPYGSMTYEAVKSLVYAKVKADDPVLAAANKWIRSNYGVSSHPGAVGMEGYFYYIVSFAKSFTAAGIKEFELADGRKVNWAADLSAHLISIQKPDGSFVNESKRWMENNPVLATAYALTALNLCEQALKK